MIFETRRVCHIAAHWTETRDFYSAGGDGHGRRDAIVCSQHERVEAYRNLRHRECPWTFSESEWVYRKRFQVFEGGIWQGATRIEALWCQRLNAIRGI